MKGKPLKSARIDLGHIFHGTLMMIVALLILNLEVRLKDKCRYLLSQQQIHLQ